LAATQPEQHIFGKLVFRPRSFELVDAAGVTTPIGQKECAILELLLSRPNQVISRDEMIEMIWGEHSFPTNRTIDNYIVKLRKWAESDQNTEVKISSVRGIGYKLELKGN
jgi:two-component system alkaline phosphatase synthesis response regulator PhoP